MNALNVSGLTRNEICLERVRRPSMVFLLTALLRICLVVVTRLVFMVPFPSLRQSCITSKTNTMLLSHVKRKLAASKGKELVELEVMRTYKPKRETLHFKDIGIGLIKSIEFISRVGGNGGANRYQFKCLVEFKVADVEKYVRLQENLRRMTEDDY